MKLFTTIFLLLILTIGALGLGWLAQLVGGVSIRSNGADVSKHALVVSEPLVAGVPTTVTYAEDYVGIDGEFVWRGDAGETLLDAGALAAKSLLDIPCSLSGQEGSLILREVETLQVLASLRTRILEASYDCALK